MSNVIDNNNQSVSYEGFPYVTFIHEKVQKELDRRQSIDSRIRSVIPWIKVTSSLKKINGNNTDAAYKVLSPLYTTSNIDHTSFTFEQLYNKTSIFKPLPGIESLNVVYKSKYGGVREAKINWKVYTLNQFEELSVYFMNPGISLFLEWGISDGLSEHTLPEKEYINISNSKFLESWKYLNDRSYRLGCRYDAMVGIIKNFDYSLNEEGGYNIITEVISTGALGYGLGVHQHVVNKGTKTEEQKKSINNKYIESLREYISNGEFENDIKILVQSGGGIDDVKVYVDNNPGKESASNYYVTWGLIEDFIINSHININLIKGENDTDKSNVLFNMDSRDSNLNSLLISNHPYLRSHDLSICILPQNEEGLSIENLTFYPDNDSFAPTSGQIRNIFVNIDVIKKAFENQFLLKDAIMFILNEINSVCALYWKFSLKVREVDNKLCVIDENYTDKSVRDILNDESNFNKLYNFKTFGGNGILNSVNFSTKMSEAVALTAMYSHHKLKTDNNIIGTNNDSFVYMFGNINENYIDEFIGNLKIYDNENKNNKDEKSITATSIYDNEYNKGFNEKTLSFLPRSKWRKYVEDNANSIDEIQAMKKLIFDYSSQNVNTSQAITPAEFSISLEGISGLRIGDIFTVDTIPLKFRKNTVFQISGIDHTINTTTWKTDINAILRVIDSTINSRVVHTVSTSEKNNNINKYSQAKHAISNPDKSVLKWIKTELGPYIRSVATQKYPEEIIAGICYTETAGLIKTHYNNGNAKPIDVVNFLIGDAGHAFGFYQIHTNTASDWLIQKNSWTDARNSSKKCVEILQLKEKAVSKYITDQNIQHAAISAYNQGEGNVRNNILNNRDIDAGNPNNYLSKVLMYANEYRNLS